MENGDLEKALFFLHLWGGTWSFLTRFPNALGLSLLFRNYRTFLRRDDITSAANLLNGRLRVTPPLFERSEQPSFKVPLNRSDFKRKPLGACEKRNPKGGWVLRLDGESAIFVSESVEFRQYSNVIPTQYKLPILPLARKYRNYTRRCSTDGLTLQFYAMGESAITF